MNPNPLALPLSLKRVSGYLELLLVSSGYTLLKARDNGIPTVIAGKESDGFVVVVMPLTSPDAMLSLADEAEAELRFLKLPTYYVQVEAIPGRHELVAYMDQRFAEIFPPQELSGFGIKVSIRPGAKAA